MDAYTPSCIHMYTYTHAYRGTYIYIYIHTHIHTNMHMHELTVIQSPLHINIQPRSKVGARRGCLAQNRVLPHSLPLAHPYLMYIRQYVRIDIYMNVYIYIYTHVCIYKYIYIYATATHYHSAHIFMYTNALS